MVLMAFKPVRLSVGGGQRRGCRVPCEGGKAGVQGGEFNRLRVLCGGTVKAFVLSLTLGVGTLRYEGDRRGGVKRTDDSWEEEVNDKFTKGENKIHGDVLEENRYFLSPLKPWGFLCM